MILYHGEHVARIQESEIESIRRVVSGPFRAEPHPFLKCGERVRVIRGALEGVEGILTRKKNLLRLVLSVSMVAQAVAVEVNASDVEPLKERMSSTDVSVTAVPSAKVVDISQAFSRGQQQNLSFVS
jgi:hypothetical protein